MAQTVAAGHQLAQKGVPTLHPVPQGLEQFTFCHREGDGCDGEG